MSDNPYYNQHIAEFTECMDEAMTAMSQNHLAAFTEMMERMDALEKRVGHLEQSIV